MIFVTEVEFRRNPNCSIVASGFCSVRWHPVMLVTFVDSSQVCGVYFSMVVELTLLVTAEKDGNYRIRSYKPLLGGVTRGLKIYLL